MKPEISHGFQFLQTCHAEVVPFLQSVVRDPISAIYARDVVATEGSCLRWILAG